MKDTSDLGDLFRSSNGHVGENQDVPEKVATGFGLREAPSVFVNDKVIDPISGHTVWRTIDRERDLELRELKVDYDYSVFALKVAGRDVVISTEFRFAGRNKTIIQYRVVGMAGSRHDFPAYKFSSREDKMRIAKYVEEALCVHGRHFSLPPGRSVEVTFADPVLSFSEGAQ